MCALDKIKTATLNQMKSMDYCLCHAVSLQQQRRRTFW